MRRRRTKADVLVPALRQVAAAGRADAIGMMAQGAQLD